MNRRGKASKTNKFFVFILILFELTLIFTPAYAWGPDREIYTYEDINSDYLAGTWPKDKIVFNSITNTPNFGDERNFVGAREYNGDDNGFENKWKGTSINVKDGQEYKLRLYVHNNSPWGYEGVATNVRTSFSIPTVSSKSVRVSGFIYADNAEPVWDSVTFASDTAFHLEYVYGSAVLENAGIGKDGYTLSDEIVTKSGGTQIGYDAIDGKIPGCYEYACYITISVKAVFDYDLTLDASVRCSNLIIKPWKNTVDANVGDKIDIQIQYKNTGDVVQKGVAMRVVLPDGLRYVEDSGQIINSSHPNGAPLEGSYIVTDGIAIGNYDPGAIAQITFTAEVTGDGLSEINNTLTSLAQVGVESLSGQNWTFVMQNSAEIVVGSGNIEPYMMIGLITIIVGCFLLIFVLYHVIRKKF